MSDQTPLHNPPNPKNKIGIMCDNFKLNMFKKELTKEGFTFETVPSGPITVIKVDGTPDKQKAIAKICKKVELHFQRGN